jgi:hypothetical protein
MYLQLMLGQQHVQRLEDQLERERQAHSDTVQDLQRRLARIADADQRLADHDGGLAKRLLYMEDEMRKIRSG